MSSFAFLLHSERELAAELGAELERGRDRLLDAGEIGPGQVLVRLRAASLNYRDLLVLRGGYGTPEDRPFEFVWQHSDDSQHHLAEFFDAVVEVFDDTGVPLKLR